jgi:polysaccharide biosynthesis protein PslG
VRAAVLLATAVVLAGAVLQACGDGSQPTPRTPARPPADFVGLVSEDLFAGSRPDRLRKLERQRQAGVRLIRQTFHWNQIETRPGRFDFRIYDDYMADVARRRMHVLPILFSPPEFRSSAPRSGRRRGTYPPRNAAAMAKFAAVLARRYGPGGSFWRDRPRLPRVPIGSWQIWNEPNLPVYWASGPDPAEYTRLLHTVGQAIKRVDPDAEIVSAGLPESDLGMPFEEFVQGMERANAASAYDVLAVHAFAADAGGAIEAVAAARRLLDDNDDDAAIWVTEIGWASDGPRSPFTVGEGGQAGRIGALLAGLAARRRELGVRGVVYYDWKDALPFPGGKDFFGLHTGLLTIDGRAKPALAAFTRAARQIICQEADARCDPD